MSTTQSPGTCIACTTTQSEQFHQAAGRPVSPGNYLPLYFGEENSGMADRFSEKFQSAGIDISAEEFEELRVFNEYLEYHVQRNMICNVQCMLLWNEWVRTFRRQVHGFPKLIREKEFRDVIMDTFGIDIVNDTSRGAIYPGLKYIP